MTDPDSVNFQVVPDLTSSSTTATTITTTATTAAAAQASGTAQYHQVAAAAAAVPMQSDSNNHYQHHHHLINESDIKEEDDEDAIKREESDEFMSNSGNNFAPPPPGGGGGGGSGAGHPYQSDVRPTIMIRRPSQEDHKSIVGRLSYMNETMYLTEGCKAEVGRNSSTSNVHFHIGQNSFISRKHMNLVHDRNNNEFFVVVYSKNGIFIDDQFYRRSFELERLPRMCYFRFPSTDIRLLFESFSEFGCKDIKINSATLSPGQSHHLHQHNHHQQQQHTTAGATATTTTSIGTNGIYSPLKIKIPKSEKKSPPPSPTGTLSAANSCPTSPRQSFRDYHSHHNNNNNNNGYQNDTVAAAASASANEYEKPAYSYAQLIVQSISASPEKQLTLSGIYSFITKNYPYYRKEANKGWQNSIRHNLSLNRYFLKVERSQDEPGKGSFWRIDPNSEAKLIDQSYRKRRQRGSQCFRTPYGMPRSAPASPSHIDHSRDSSPLHDIVLQSAPGSPQQSSSSSAAAAAAAAAAAHQQSLGGNSATVAAVAAAAAAAQRNGGGGGGNSNPPPLPMWSE